MTDRLVRLHLKEPDLLVVALTCPATARTASQLHHCLPTSARLYAEGIAAGFGVSALLGGEARINLQLACDGPLKGLLVDADARGQVRGYLKNSSVNFGPKVPGAEPALGGVGALAVLRELKPGEFYRGEVALEHFELARDLERFYLESEQIETLVRLECSAIADEPLGRVSALFVQRMPDAAPGAVDRARSVLEGRPLAGEKPFEIAAPLLEAFPGEWELQAEYPLSYECGCSAERVLRAVMAMGPEEIEDLLTREGRAVATCVFCNKTYSVPGDDLRKLLARFAPKTQG
jgi:molecular chaperone Hsp33